MADRDPTGTSDEIEERLEAIDLLVHHFNSLNRDEEVFLLTQVWQLRQRVAELEGVCESALNTGGLRFGEDALTRSVRGKILKALPGYKDPWAGTTGALRAVESDGG